MPLDLRPLPPHLPEPVRRWAETLRQLAEATGEPSVRQLAPKVLCSSATLSRYLQGQRPAETWPVAERLATLAAARGSTVQPNDILKSLWEQAVKATKERGAQQGHTQTSNGQRGLAERLWRRLKTPTGATAGIAVVAAVLTITIIGLRGGFSSDPPSLPAPKTWPAKIINTWSKASNQYLGAYSYKSPFSSERAGGGYGEGVSVLIVCQERHGRKVTDPTLQTTSEVWNKTTDGVYLLDIYTDLPKAEGTTPPDGIPMCVYPEGTPSSR